MFSTERSGPFAGLGDESALPSVSVASPVGFYMGGLGAWVASLGVMGMSFQARVMSWRVSSCSVPGVRSAGRRACQ